MSTRQRKPKQQQTAPRRDEETQTGETPTPTNPLAEQAAAFANVARQARDDCEKREQSAEEALAALQNRSGQ